MSSSTSVNESIQRAIAQITQQISVQCSVSCQNYIGDINIDLRDSKISGGINITQECSVDGSCLSDATISSVSEIALALDQAAAAANQRFNFGSEAARNYAYMTIQQQLNQGLDQQCSMNSVNELTSVNIFAENVDLSGGIVIAQTGSVGGACMLDGALDAAAFATGTITQTADTGKAAKKGAGFNKEEFWKYFAIIVGAFIGLAALVAVIMALQNKKQS